LKQVGLAFLQYAQDYDEKNCPGAALANLRDNPTANVAWDYFIEPYAQKSSTVQYGAGQNPLLRCPSDSIIRTSNGLITGTPLAETSTRSYVIGSSDQGTRTPAAKAEFAWKEQITLATPISHTYTEGRVLSEFPTPATTIMLTEGPSLANRMGTQQGYRVQGPGSVANEASSQRVAKDSLHFDGWNYMFVDGHVKWLRPNATTIPARGGNNNSSGYFCTGGVNRLKTPCAMWTIDEGD
jgi:prepilin-type processing-associated H-X9-DG protein